MTLLTLSDLESRWGVLQEKKIKVLTPDIEKEMDYILDQLDQLPEDSFPVDDKVRILELRSKVRLLRPSVCKESEDDLYKILKLNKGSVETWVTLGECLLRRNACKEATEALENAIQMDPHHKLGLCLYSQILRCRCASSEKLTIVEKVEFLDKAIKMSKTCVELDVQNGEAWNSLALSLLSRTTLEGASRDGLRKAFAAIEQAVRQSPNDPDVRFNKGVMESLLGRFDTASMELVRAYEIDRKGLKGVKSAYEENVAVLRRIVSTIENTKTVGKADFKNCLRELEFFSRKVGNHNGAIRHFNVVSVVSAPTMQPVVLLTVDVQHHFVVLLIYQVRAGAFKVSDTLTLPIQFLQVDKGKRLMTQRVEPYLPFNQEDPVEVNLPHFFVDYPQCLQINGQEIPESFRASLQVSARLFA